MTDGMQRLLFLSQVSTAIGSSLDADNTLRLLVRLVVPVPADWCAVDLFEGETSRRVTVVGRSVERRADDVSWVLGALPAESDASLVRALLGSGALF